MPLLWHYIVRIMLFECLGLSIVGVDPSTMSLLKGDLLKIAKVKLSASNREAASKVLLVFKGCSDCISRDWGWMWLTISAFPS